MIAGVNNYLKEFDWKALKNSVQTNNRPALYASGLYFSRNEQEAQETGGNPITCVTYFFFTQGLLFDLITTKRPIRFTGARLLFQSIPTALYILGKINKEAYVKMGLKFLPKLKPILEPIKPTLDFIRPVTKHMDSILDTAGKVASLAVYISFFNAGLTFAPALGVCLMSIRIIRNNTTLLPDKTTKVFNNAMSIIASIISTTIMYNSFYNSSKLGKIYFLALRLSSSDIPYLTQKWTQLITGNLPYALDTQTLLHHTDNSSFDTFIKDRSQPLIINTSHYAAIPKDYTAYEETKARSVSELRTEFKQFITNFKTKLPNDDYFNRMLALYQSQDDLNSEEIEKIELLKRAWNGEISQDAHLIELYKQTIGLTDVKLAQWSRYKGLTEEWINNSPIAQRPTFRAKKQEAINQLNIHQESIAKIKDINKVKEFFQEEKEYYEKYFTLKFEGLLDQLESGTFTQGGLIDVNVLKKQITFIFDCIKNNINNDETRNALFRMTKLIEKCNFCNTGVSESIRNLALQINYFTENKSDTLKNQIYYLLKVFNEQQSMYLGTFQIGAALGKELSNDVHVNKNAIRIDNVNKHFNPNANIKHMNLFDYMKYGVLPPIIDSIVDPTATPPSHRFFNPELMIARIQYEVRQSPSFSKRFESWKKDIRSKLRGKLCTEKDFIKLLLIDTGVLKLDQNPDITGELGEDIPTWAKTLSNFHPKILSFVKQLFPPVPRSAIRY